MDKLTDLLTKILIDIAKAQHNSNKFSSRLSEKYKDPEKYNLPKNLAYFPVPNSLFKEFDFELKFGLQELESIIGPINSKIINNLIEYTSDYLSEIYNLSENQKNILFKNLKTTWTPLNIISVTSDQNIFDNLLQGILLDCGIKNLNEEDYNRFRRIVTLELINQIQKQYQQSEINKVKSFNTVYDMKLLNETGEEIICTIKGNIEMRNFKWGFSEEDNNQNEFLI